MTKHELRRQSLVKLVEKLGKGGITRVAAAIGKEPNYVSRMLYPSDKKGQKNIGEDSWDDLVRAYPEISSEWKPSASEAKNDWPLDLVSQDQYALLTHAEKCRVQVHMADEIEKIIAARADQPTKKAA